jgi:CBS domain-containing protein
MSQDEVICVQPDTDLDEVEKLMGRNQVRRIPVVDGDKRVLGMIALADLARERKSVGESDFGKVVERISEPVSVR